MNECRDAYLKEIVKATYSGDDVYLVAADLAAPCLDKFREDYPKRYVPVGIAEQNLIAVASGLALAGKKAIAYTLNPFIIFRGFDQIRNCIGLMNLPVTLLGFSSGFNMAKDGITHLPLEDLNMLRGVHNLTIYNISDINLARHAAKKTLNLTGPLFVRIDRLVNQEYALAESDIERGYRFLNRAGGKVCVVSTGIMSSDCLEVLQSRTDFLERVTLIDVFSFPFDEKSLLEDLKNFEQIITVEELRLQGGLGSAVLETLSDAGIYIPVKRLGVDLSRNLSQHYGSREWHLKNFGLDKESIAEKISAALND